MFLQSSVLDSISESVHHTDVKNLVNPMMPKTNILTGMQLACKEINGTTDLLKHLTKFSKCWKAELNLAETAEMKN